MVNIAASINQRIKYVLPSTSTICRISNELRVNQQHDGNGNLSEERGAWALRIIEDSDLSVHLLLHK